MLMKKQMFTNKSAPLFSSLFTLSVIAGVITFATIESHQPTPPGPRWSTVSPVPTEFCIQDRNFYQSPKRIKITVNIRQIVCVPPAVNQTNTSGPLVELCDKIKPMANTTGDYSMLIAVTPVSVNSSRHNCCNLEGIAAPMTLSDTIRVRWSADQSQNQTIAGVPVGRTKYSFQRSGINHKCGRIWLHINLCDKNESLCKPVFIGHEWQDLEIQATSWFSPSELHCDGVAFERYYANVTARNCVEKDTDERLVCGSTVSMDVTIKCSGLLQAYSLFNNGGTIQFANTTDAVNVPNVVDIPTMRDVHYSELVLFEKNVVLTYTSDQGKSWNRIDLAAQTSQPQHMSTKLFRNGAAAVTVNSNIVIMCGGFNGHEPLASCEYYSDATQSWNWFFTLTRRRTQTTIYSWNPERTPFRMVVYYVRIPGLGDGFTLACALGGTTELNYGVLSMEVRGPAHINYMDGDTMRSQSWLAMAALKLTDRPKISDFTAVGYENSVLVCVTVALDSALRCYRFNNANNQWFVCEALPRPYNSVFGSLYNTPLGLMSITPMVNQPCFIELYNPIDDVWSCAVEQKKVEYQVCQCPFGDFIDRCCLYEAEHCYFYYRCAVYFT